MRKRFAAAVVLCLVMSVLPVRAANVVDSGTCGANLTWTLDDTGVLTISGTGPMADYQSNDHKDTFGNLVQESTAPWSTLYQKISSVNIGDGVTSIGGYAFYACSGIKSVILPSSLTYIENNAFEACLNLDSVVIPNGVTSIGDRAFSSCRDLKSVTIPNSVTDIGEFAFLYCGNLLSVDIPDSVTTIGTGAFSWCESLTSVSIPSSITAIQARTFYRCDKLTTVYLPKSVITVYEEAFYLSHVREVYYNSTWEDYQKIQYLKTDGTPMPRDLFIGVSLHLYGGVHTVTFDPNGGTVTPASKITEATGKLADLPTPTYSDTCHTFTGWHIVNGNASTKIDENYVFTQDTTVYAYWDVKHTEETVAGTPATCTTAGQTDGKKCSVCGEILVAQTTIDPLGHNWDDGKTEITKDPTCSKEGATKTTKTCKRCGDTEETTGVIQKTPHTEVVDPGKAATCTENGETDGIKCSVCNAEIKAKQPVPALGHKPVDIPDKAPTCGAPGSTGGKECSVCRTELEKPTEIPATGDHTPGRWIGENITTQPTCTMDGVKTVTYECGVCGGMFGVIEPIAAGHQWGAEDVGRETKPASCTEKGVITYTRTCQRPGCGATETRTEETDMLPHTEETIDSVPATCTTEGKTEGTKCSVCDTVLTAQKKIPAPGHKWGESQETTVEESTCSEKGSKTVTRTCTVCNEVETKEEELDLLPHTWGEWKVIREPAATESGIKERACTVCGKTDARTIPATGEKPKVFTVVFYEENGTEISRQEVSNGQNARELQAPAREGYTFDGWFTQKTGGEKWNFDEPVTKDIDLYAHWTKKADDPNPPAAYTVTFDSQDGSAVASQSVTSGQKAVKPADPTKSGHTFGGWFKEAECTNAWSFDTDTVTGNITLYAKWTKGGGTSGTPGGEDKPNPDNPGTGYTVTFHPNGGDGGSVTRTTGTGGQLSSLPGGPSRSGYDFDGWYTASSGGQRITLSTVFQSDTTVYAHWERESPSASRHRIYAPGRVTGGSLSVSHSSAYEDTRITLELDPRSGYELDWISVTNLDTGRELRLTERRWDEYTFLMPDSDVEVELAYCRRSSGGTYFVPTQPQARSGPTAWYYRDGHIYHFTSGLVPDSSYLTRDMLISVLYNLTDHSLDGNGAMGSETTDSQIWATSNEILPDIHASGLWGVDKFLSREQAAMLMHRYAGYRGCDTSRSTGLTRFADYGQVRPIARTAMSWVLASGVMPEGGGSSLAPRDNLTCGQAGDMIYRFLTSSVWTR